MESETVVDKKPALESSQVGNSTTASLQSPHSVGHWIWLAFYAIAQVSVSVLLRGATRWSFRKKKKLPHMSPWPPWSIFHSEPVCRHQLVSMQHWRTCADALASSQKSEQSGRLAASVAFDRQTLHRFGEI